MRWLTKMSQNCALCFHIFQKMQNREQISDFFVPLMLRYPWNTKRH